MKKNLITGIFNTLGYFRVKQLGGKPFYSIGGFDLGKFWGETAYEQYIKDFIEIPPINAIINYKARAESMLKLEVISKTDGKPFKNNKPLIKVLRNPNWFQSQTEWWRQSSISRSVFGNEIQYLLTPFGQGVNYMGIFNMPIQNILIYCPEKHFFLTPEMPESIQYYFKLPGETNMIELKTKDIIHLNDNRMTYRPDRDKNDMQMRTNYLWGTSKMASLTPNRENMRVAYEARNTLRKLPVGFMTNKAKDAGGTAPMMPTEKDELYKKMGSNYGLTLDKRQIILTGLTLGFEQTIVDISKLELYKEIEEDAEEVCNEYGIPFELIGKKDVTYENKKEAKRQMYQDTIIPGTAEKIEALNKIFKTEGESWEIVATFDHLPIFQENKKERAASLNLLVSALSKALADGAIDQKIYAKELANFGVT